jgi:F0F1-type ATP synthase epsilon subunit
MKSFKLKIIKPTKKDVFDVEWLDIQTPSGNFFVGPEHEDLITILKERSPISYKKINTTKPESIDSYGGFLKIEKGQASIILDL